MARKTVGRRERASTGPGDPLKDGSEDRRVTGRGPVLARAPHSPSSLATVTQRPFLAGFGFVTLSEDEAVELILREQTHEIDGRNLTVRRASHRSSGPLDNNGLPKRLAGDSSAAASAPTDNLKKVFLGGLEASMSEEVVRAACSAFGQVTDVQITSGALTPSGRGFGFVTFTTLTAANSMVTRGTIEIEGKIINIQSAQPRAASAAASSRPPMGSGMVQRPPLAGAVYGGGGMGGMGHGMSHGMGGGMAMGQGVGGAAYGHGCYGGGAMGYYGGGAMGCYGGPGMGGGAAIGGGAAMGCYGGGCGSVPGYGAAHQPSWGPSTAGSSGCGSGYGQVAYSAGGYGPMRSASHHRTGPY